MTMTKIPAEFKGISGEIKRDADLILDRVLKNRSIEDFPKVAKRAELSGSGAAVAYPIQGVLKYHGMPDWDFRTAFMPSVSLNNDAAKSVTTVEFDKSLNHDHAIINGKTAEGRDLERVKQTLDMIRSLTGAKTFAKVESKNIVRASKTGKGLGTSASGSAALALAAIHASLGEEYSTNNRFVTVVSRFLAGSGCRSAAGGLAYWHSYPGIKHEDSFALRLDTKGELKDVSLVTVPVDSRIGLKTEQAHQDAPNSPFFRDWLLKRKAQSTQLLDALDKGDWETIAKLAEMDTILLHGVTMSGSFGNKIIAWEPETLQMMRAANEMRNQGIKAYYSIDTGPTPVFITHKSFEQKVAGHLKQMGFQDVITGKIAGPAKVMPIEEARMLLRA